MSLPNGVHPLPPGKVAAVMTKLEMHAPAPLRGAALPEGLTLSDAVPAVPDYLDLFRRVGRDWLWFGHLLMPEDELAVLLKDPKFQTFTLMKDGRAEGLMQLDFRTSGACELAYFGVTPALVGAGAGSYLMDQAITRAWAEDITRLWVKTCTNDSPQALEFYVRSGFTPYQRLIEIEDDPRLTGYYDTATRPSHPVI